MGELLENRGKKYALLTEELYKNLRNANRRAEQTQSAEFSQILALDDKIKDILASQVPDTMKARMYAEAANDYFQLREKAPETRKPETFPIRPLALTSISTQTFKTSDKDAETISRAQATQVPAQAAAIPVSTQYEEEPEIFEDASATVPSDSKKLPTKEEKIQEDRIEKIMDFISQHEDFV